LLGVLKSREDAYRPYAATLAKGDDLVALIQTGAVAKRRPTAGKRNKASDSDGSDRYFDDDLADDIVVTGTSSVTPGQANRESDAVETLLSHPPRPRKKSRR
jgi:hypothetical protein